MHSTFATALIMLLFSIQSSSQIKPIKIEDPNISHLYQKIVEEFDKVDGHLDEILNPVPTMIFLLEPPVKNRTKCSVSKDELVKLRDQIKDIMNNASSTEQGKCDFSEESDDNCNSWLKLIQCGVKELGDGFRNASSSSASLEEIAKWKSAYDSLLQQYQKDIDNVKTSLSEEFKKKIDQLTTELQSLSLLISKTQEELKKTYIKLCVSEISNGKSGEALNIFKQLKDVSLLAGIVTSSFTDYGKRSNVNNIVNFIKKLPHCNQDRIAYPVLFSLMKDSSSLLKPEVVTLYDAVQQCMCKSDLKKELQKYAS